MSCNTPSIDQTDEAVELSLFFYVYSIFQSFKLNLWRLGHFSKTTETRNSSVTAAKWTTFQNLRNNTKSAA